MLSLRGCVCILSLLPAFTAAGAFAQPLGPPDRGKPGDAMIQRYLARRAVEMDEGFLKGVATAEDWERGRTELRRGLMSMLGLFPVPERSDLAAKTTGTVEGDGFIVENVHYQSRPGLYVTGNLYRPAKSKPGERFPAVFYVCGHSGMGRDGNKTAFMPHGIWFARHGYVCLIVDTLQLGEIAATHHGTYNLDRWWWHSRGYTPAGVECWNGVRGIDYLIGRPDVDLNRIGATGISGGGATTFWIAAADERVKIAAPVSGMADLESYLANYVINGHCDCMFDYNAFGLAWTGVAGLVAPRPLLFVNSDQDAIFPMDANRRIIARLERLYSLFGAGDLVDSVVSVGGHAYRRDIRAAVYRFFNIHFKNDARPVEDAEVDVVPESGRDRKWPIEPSRLRVFKTDADIPADAINARIDETFTPLASKPPADRDSARRALHAISPLSFPLDVKPAEAVDADHVRTEADIVVPLRRRSGTDGHAGRIVLVATDAVDPMGDAWKDRFKADDLVYVLQPRGVGETEWTAKGPPNYVARAHALIGRTVDSGRLQDVRAAVAFLRKRHPDVARLTAVGSRGAGLLCVYASLFDGSISDVVAVESPKSHRDAGAPALMNVLRVMDVADAVRLAPVKIATEP